MLDSAIVGLIVVAGALAIAFISHSELSSLLKSAIAAAILKPTRAASFWAFSGPTHQALEANPP
jgi:hypothetical protein